MNLKEYGLHESIVLIELKKYLDHDSLYKKSNIFINILEKMSRYSAYFLFGIALSSYILLYYYDGNNKIIEGIEEYVGVTIVASHSEEIRKMIIEVMGRGVTVYMGKYGYGRRGGNENVEIIYTVITRLELNKLNTELARIEPDAFVVMSSVKDTRGGMIKKRPLKH